MVTIRLARKGRKKRTFYHIVVTDSRNPRDGRYIERLGFCNPSAEVGREVSLQIATDRVDYWIAQGAQTSKQILSLIKKANKEINKSKEPAGVVAAA